MSDLTVEKWINKYRPIVNHIDPNASWQDDSGNGIMFETYGAELDYVRSQIDHNKVWTYMDTDNGGTCIGAGFSFVNRIGYFVTERAWEDLDIFVAVSEPECPKCDRNPDLCTCDECGECTTNQSCNCGGK